MCFSYLYRTASRIVHSVGGFLEKWDKYLLGFDRRDMLGQTWEAGMVVRMLANSLSWDRFMAASKVLGEETIAAAAVAAG